MPKISFNFSGFCQDADIDIVTNGAGETQDVSQMDSKELARGLNSGKYFISLGDYLYEGRKNEAILEDFEGE